MNLRTKATASRSQRERIDFGSQQLGIERIDFFQQVSKLFGRLIDKECQLTRVEAGRVLAAMKANYFERLECCGRLIKPA